MRTVLLGAFGLGAMVAAAAEPPPVTAFTNFAQFETAAVSPAGTYLAVTQRGSRGEILNVLTLPDLKAVSRGSFGELTDIERLEWANDHRVLLQPMRRFAGLTAYKVPTGEIIGIDADGKNMGTLFGYAAGQQQTGTRLRQRESIDAPARMLATLPEDPRSVLIQSYGYGIKGEFNSVYRMDVSSGLLARIAMSPIHDGTF